MASGQTWAVGEWLDMYGIAASQVARQIASRTNQFDLQTLFHVQAARGEVQPLEILDHGRLRCRGSRQRSQGNLNYVNDVVPMTGMERLLCVVAPVSPWTLDMTASATWRWRRCMAIMLLGPLPRPQYT
ncbi:predicted protein [Pyrenophora tritici-repentis Pt-1C-BFP]|uniref:Uncharacterized protein n=1 Tax=Pyrenophora tritici-repentis (strain Pt-1C-BFP) TaxID=426418 RepID=B2VZ16_PYRTR|nr:uncharacterized protein PTRG_02656 [Pyrenophora tritici-repentis Pt-1C-BFP]EDU45179.1 predicted protein [Pyrenophora tritici-repentis Pt-1C-BFP]